ncbi:MAG: radical SAM protein [Archaeoglobi archaeon]|nr:radical SAM protein [Archaeoglobi archaeon]
MTEFNPFFKRYSKGLRRVAVVYPNRYVGGISNLGIQRLYFEVNRSEKYLAFYTDVFDGLRSVENATLLKDFEVSLFSIQYEEDVFNAVRILRESGFSGRSVAGGPCVIQNPFPYAKIFDRLFVGEAENAVLDVVEDRAVEGLVPHSYRRRRVELDSEMRSEIIGEGAYGRALIVEIGRGCPRGCRFCVVRQIYSPARWRSAESILEFAEENRKLANKVAIVAPSPTDHPEFKEIVSGLRELGFEVSPSSIRADRFDEEMAELISGARTLTLAPEAGSERLREALNKGISEDDIISAVEIAESAERIKLYFMFGLPGEEQEDLEEIVRMVERIRRMGRKVSVSANPLVPKPHTPFQWLPYGGDPERDVRENLRELKRKRKFLLSRLRRVADVDVESVERFAVQTIISRGDESVGELIAGGARPSEILKRASEFLEPLPPDEELPWDRIEMGYRKGRLRREFELVMERFG